jgi:hypothetical protein
MTNQVFRGAQDGKTVAHIGKSLTTGHLAEALGRQPGGGASPSSSQSVPTPASEDRASESVPATTPNREAK